MHSPISSRFRKLAHWLALRDARYIGLRLATLVRRYGVTANRAKTRALACVKMLDGAACRPTFFVPGQVVGRNGAFCRELQRLGAELAVHGYHHVDFRALSAAESRRQFAKAVAAYERQDIAFEGFRCPYLSYTPPLADLLPDSRFAYSSNRAIWRDVVPPGSGDWTGRNARATFDLLARCYQPLSASTHLALPEMTGRLVEIPVCLPDDLQLLDGLRLNVRGVEQAWVEVLQHTHRRGELFDLMFHPESFEQCATALEGVLRAARNLVPPVWVTQLREVSRWWREKASFRIERVHGGRATRFVMRCSHRATVLVRHMDLREHSEAWYGPYRVLTGRTLECDLDVLPFIGVASDTPPSVAAFLREQGYLVETGAEADRCGLLLTVSELERFQNQVELIDFIESASTPLVRFWRWPANARSALCITGDLDALSLRDYAARLFPF